MKTVFGVLLFIVGVLFFICGFAGGIIGSLYMLAMAVWTVVQAFQAGEATFWTVFSALLFYVLRQVVAFIIIAFSWFTGTICFAAGKALI